MKLQYNIFILILAMASCNGKSHKPKSYQEMMRYKEPLVEVNRYLVDKDSVQIAAWCGRRQIEMKCSQSGLWYSIQHTGTGDSAQAGRVANIKYTISLLNGKVCYSSDSTGIKSFLIGQGGVETGLEIGILKLREGDKAKFIFPPSLAHGLLGDEKKIPARSIIVYDLELVKLTNR
jgi:FKBP-type peptidyl-prolyl cis-trans isomerase FkpA